MQTPDEFRSWPDLLPHEREHWLLWAKQPGQCLVTLDDALYPPLLRQTPAPPPVLFVRGNVEVLELPQIAIVGSRCPTVDGCKNAREFATGLSRAGYVVTSGMAMGIDTEAHRGALDAGGITVAVLGTGLDCIPGHRSRTLAAKIAKRGAVISEFLPNVPAQSFHFPQRNRVISGLAHGVLVVEAAEKSGSLITARCAGDQGREVFAVPGSIHNLLSRGCHRLLRQGAKLAENVDDLLEEFPALVQWERERISAARPQLTKAQQRVLDHIAHDPVSIDVLLQRVRCALPELYGCLLQLELGGYVVNGPSGYALSPP